MFRRGESATPDMILKNSDPVLKNRSDSSSSRVTEMFLKRLKEKDLKRHFYELRPGMKSREFKSKNLVKSIGENLTQDDVKVSD